MIYGILAFSSTHDAMAAEKRLKPLFAIVMLPTPRSITASCGISLRFGLEDLEKLRQVLPQLSGYALYQMQDANCIPLELQ